MDVALPAAAWTAVTPGVERCCPVTESKTNPIEVEGGARRIRGDGAVSCCGNENFLHFIDNSRSVPSF
jgi:hypothetical protein